MSDGRGHRWLELVAALISAALVATVVIVALLVLVVIAGEVASFLTSGSP